MSAQATQTPWHVSGGDNVPIYIDGPDRIGIAMMDGLLEQRQANAELIVRAVNCHGELVEALEALLRASYGHDEPNAMRMAEAAIAKARQGGSK